MNWRFWQRSERKNGTLELLRALYGGRTASTGQTITWDNAAGVSAVFACARVIANGLAQVPWKLFRETGRTRQPARAHPLFRLLHRKPNAYQTSFEFRQTIGLHLALTGNAYVYIDRAPVSRRVLSLLPLDPKSVCVRRDPKSWAVSYEISDFYGGSITLPPDRIWHIKGPAWCTYLGLDVVNTARNAIGLALATEESHGKFHKHGVNASGVYSIEGPLSPVQHEQILEYLKKHAADSAGLPLIIDRGAKWLQTQMSGVDVQHLETRIHQAQEVCRHMGVMPIMIGISDKVATYASAEQMFLAHIVHTMMPWYACIEQSTDAHLLSERDVEEGHYTKFVHEALMRGVLKDTAFYLDKMVNGGLMTPNEAREKLDLNPDTDSESDRLRVPANIVGKEAPAPADEDDRLSAVVSAVNASHTRLADAVAQAAASLSAQPPAPVNVHVTAKVDSLDQAAERIGETMSRFAEQSGQSAASLEGAASALRDAQSDLTRSVQAASGDFARAHLAAATGQKKLAASIDRLAEVNAKPRRVVEDASGRAIGTIPVDRLE